MWRQQPRLEQPVLPILFSPITEHVLEEVREQFEVHGQ